MNAIGKYYAFTYLLININGYSRSWRRWIQQVIFNNNYKFHVIFAFYDEKLLWKSLLHFITYDGDKGMSEVYLTFGTHRDQRKVFLHAAIDMSHNACHFSTTQRRCSKCGNIFIEIKKWKCLVDTSKHKNRGGKTILKSMPSHSFPHPNQLHMK